MIFSHNCPREAKTAECKKLEEELKTLKNSLNQKPEPAFVDTLADQLKLYNQNFSHFIREKVGDILVNKIDSKLADHQKKMEIMESLIKTKLPQIIKKAGDKSLLQKQNEDYLQQSRDYQQLLKSAENQIKAFGASLDSLAKKNNELEAENKRLHAELAHRGNSSSSEEDAAKIRNLEELLEMYQKKVDEQLNLEDSHSFKFNTLAKENENLKKELEKSKEEKNHVKEKLEYYFKEYNEKSDLLSAAEKITTEVYTFFINKLPPHKMEQFWMKEFSFETIKEIYNTVMAQSIDVNKRDKVKINSPEPKDQVLLMRTPHYHYIALTQIAGCKVMFMVGKDDKAFIEK